MRLISRLSPLGGALLAAASFLPAQEQQLPAQQLQAPPGYVLSIAISDTQVFEEKFWDTRIGQMLQSDSMADVVDQTRKRFSKLEQRIEELTELAGGLTADKDIQDTLEELMTDASQLYMKSARLYVYFDSETSAPTFIGFLSPRDERSDNWQRIVKNMRAMAENNDVERREDGEIAGGKLEIYQDGDADQAFCLVERDSESIVGFGDMELVKKVALADASTDGLTARVLRTSGIAVHVHMDPIWSMIREESRDDEQIKVIEALGFSGIESISMGLDTDGAHYRENYFVALRNGAQGLMQALASQVAAGPNLPMPQPALLQWRGALDTAKVIDAVNGAREAVGREPREDGAKEISPADVSSTFPGGFTFGVSAPPGGGMVPRLSMALRVSSADAFAEFRKKMEVVLEGITLEDRTFQDVQWTSIRIPNSPAPMVPSFALIGDTLLLGENPATLKRMIRIAKEGDVQPPIDIANAPAVMPEGMTADATLTFDVGATYQLMNERYLPMVQLGMNMMMQQLGASASEPLYEPSELPDPRDMAKDLGVGVGGMAVTEDGIFMSVASVAGDPLAAAALCMGAPIGGQITSMMMQQAIGDLEGQIAKARVDQLWSAIRTWQASFGSSTTMPKDLGELMTRGLVDDTDTFLIPGVDDNRTVEFENEDGDIEELETAYRYVPDSKIKVSKNDLLWMALPDLLLPQAWSSSSDDEMVRVILYEASESTRGNRVIMTEDGKSYLVPEQRFQDILANR